MKNYSKSASNLKFRISILVLILVLIRTLVIYFNLTTHGGRYLLSQIVFTVAWTTVACFMYQCSMMFTPGSFEYFQIKFMKKTAFYAMYACLARVIVYAMYKWPMVSYDAETKTVFMWPTIHNILEEVVWFLLALFFFYYWRARSDQYNRIMHKK